MSRSQKNVQVNGAWGIPWLVIGLVLYFATDSSNTWWGIHTKHAGLILLYFCGISFAVVLGIVALIFVIAAIAAIFGR